MKNHQRGHAESHSWSRERAAVWRQTACSVEESKIAPDPSTPAGSSTEANPLLRRFLGGMSIFTLLMTVPQVLTIWVGHKADGVSVVSWSAYLLSAVLWFWFGLLQRDKNIYLPCVGWVVLDGAVIAGALVYG